MRVTALIVLAVCLAFGSATALAEKVKTNQSTKVYARPGEQAKVLVTVKSGQNMTLLRKDGRWLKVRVNGMTGYVPRSKVDMADDDEIARNTRRRPFVDGRSRRRQFGGDAPDDRIGADATTSEPDEGKGGDDEDEEEDSPKKSTKTASKGGDDDEDSGDEDDSPKKPEPKKADAKKVEPKKVATAAKAHDEDEDEEDEPKKGGDDGDEEDEDDKPSKTAAKKGGDEDDEDGGDTKKDDRPTAHVAKKTQVYEKASTDSEPSFVVRPTDMLYPQETKGDFTYVENEEGDGGWIETSELEMSSGGGSGKKAIDVRAGLGLMIIQQGVRSAGSNNFNVPDNYNIGTSSIAVSLGAGILIPKGQKMLLGGEFTYDYAKTVGGGVFYDADGMGGSPGVNTGLTIHNVNVRAMAGIDMKKKSGMAVFARLGYRYQGFLVDNVESATANPARLPSEVVKAPTLGAALSIPRLSGKIGMKVALDAIVFGASVKQTQGLEDGKAPSVKAVVVGANVVYHWKQKMDLQAQYNLEYMGINFGPPLMTSMRNHMGTSVSRTDFFHMVTVGIAKPF